jgi:chromate reductase
MKEVKAYDAVLFVTPSTTAPFQLASRMRSMWARVPSEKAYGTENRAPWSALLPARSVDSAPTITYGNRWSFSTCRALQMPEAYIGNIANRFDQTGALSDKSPREFLQQFMIAYADWVERACNTSLS